MKFRSDVVVLVALAAGCTITQDPMLDPRDAGTDVMPDVPAIDGGFRCVPDALGCFGDVRYRCGADGISRLEETTCPEACDVALGCVACVPGSRRCEGDVSMVCLDDASGYTYGRDCGDWDVACGDDGYCEDDCAVAEADRTYVGCEYWPAPLANLPDLRTAYDFRVVITNPGRVVAEVTITRGPRLIERESIAPGAAVDISLPWIDEVSFAFATERARAALVADGAYRLRSDQPVIVAQFNPFHYAAVGAEPSYTNDASLLLPAHVLGTEHVALSYGPLSIERPGGPPEHYPGFLALVGHDPAGTDVTIETPVALAADRDGRFAATAAGGTLSFSLARGEIAQLVPAAPPACDPTRPGYVETDIGSFCDEPEHDLTGAIVRTSAPVAAWGGHVCANVPTSVIACDHLETTLAPVATWGRRFWTAPMADPGAPTPNFLRIVAAHDGTRVTVTPPIDGIDADLVLDAGEHVEALLDEPVAIEASQPIEIGQYLVGQNYTTPARERGDPGLTALVPEEQYRSSYVFITPTSYAPVSGGQSWLLVSREPGADLTLDGAAVEATWTAVSGRELATIPVDGGAHRLVGEGRFGVIAFGLGAYTSYAYPAGLDLIRVPL